MGNNNEVIVEALIEAAPVQISAANIVAIRAWAQAFMLISTQLLVSDCCYRGPIELTRIRGLLETFAEELKKVCVEMEVNSTILAAHEATEKQLTEAYVRANRTNISVAIVALGPCLAQLVRVRKYAAALLGEQTEKTDAAPRPQQTTKPSRSVAAVASEEEDSSASAAALAYRAHGGNPRAAAQLAELTGRKPFAKKEDEIPWWKKVLKRWGKKDA